MSAERRTSLAKLALCLLATLTLAAGAAAAPFDIDAAIRRGDDPEIVRGPVEDMEIINLNKVRYRISIGQEVTFADGPELGIFGPLPEIGGSLAVADVAEAAAEAETPGPPQAPVQPGVETDRAPPCPPTTGDAESRFAQIQKCVAVEARCVQNLLNSAKEARALLEAERKKLTSLVLESDQTLLADDRATTLASRVKDEVEDIDTALEMAKKHWPTTTQLSEHRATIQALQKALRDLPFDFADQWSTVLSDRGDVHYLELLDALPQLLQALDPLAPDGELGKAYAEATKNLTQWQQTLTPLQKKEAFSVKIGVRCGYPFWNQKTVEYTLTRIDRTISDPAKNKSVEPLIQVVCPSRFTVSGGVAWSWIDEQDYEFVSSNKNGELVNVIGLTNEGEGQINPMVIVSTRLGSARKWGPRGGYGIHLSAGVVTDFDNPESDVTFGYLLGLSASFMDHFLLTGGVQASRVGELAGGFELGDVQPTGLNTVPLTEEWQYNAVLAVSYKLGGGS